MGLHQIDTVEQRVKYLREVLRTLIFKEMQCATRDGSWFMVRIMPYRTLENVIDGVVITFTDASAARTLEASLRAQASPLRQVAESVPWLVWGSRPNGSCDDVNRGRMQYTGLSEPELIGYSWLDQVQDSWRVAVREGTELACDFRIRGANGVYRWFRTRARPIRDPQHQVIRWHGINTDVDDLKS